NSWKEHLAAMDYLRQGIHFRGYAQKDPKQEYKREAFEMFTHLLDHIKYEVIGILFKVQVKQEQDVQVIDEQRRAPKEMHFEHAQAPVLEEPEPSQPVSEPPAVEQPYIRHEKKIGRNDSCPCGSGKKYKHCHGKIS
ncbi:MAG: SEC-C metal-binding domain-containing protein, partial [Methylobacter sp.]